MGKPSADIQNFSRDPQHYSEEETLTNILDSINSFNDAIVNTAWVSSNIDTKDNTYYYLLSFIPGTTKWRINRLHKTTYVSEYATGEGDINTAWANRKTLETYATIY